MNFAIMKSKKFIFIAIVFILAIYGVFCLRNIPYISRHFRNNTNIVKVTIPEGYSTEQIGQALEKSGLVTKHDFMNAVENWKSDKDTNYWFLKGIPNNKHKLDGFLYPATYSFNKKMSSREIVVEMLNAFSTHIQPYKEYITKSNLNTKDVVIIASLIEKEAKKDVDRPKISSVIYNRLNKKMPLQIDATILYVIGHKDKLYNKDLKVKSPYNTYLNTGLPPSAICNPGTKSISAAVHPANTKYLYYVLDNKTNEHIFSETYSNHLKNISKYNNK